MSGGNIYGDYRDCQSELSKLNIGIRLANVLINNATIGRLLAYSNFYLALESNTKASPYNWTPDELRQYVFDRYSQATLENSKAEVLLDSLNLFVQSEWLTQTVADSIKRDIEAVYS